MDYIKNALRNCDFRSGIVFALVAIAYELKLIRQILEKKKNED